ERHVPEVTGKDVAKESVAVAGAAAIIRTEDEPALARKHRKVLQQQPGTGAELVGVFGAAMELHDERIAGARCVVPRVHQHAFDRRPIIALPRELLLPRHGVLLLEHVEDIRHARWLAALDRERPGVAEARRL